jgi:hypothetical protein
MAREITPAEVEKAIRSLSVAEKTNLGIEVTLPVAFGDGELVTVVIERTGDEFAIHDSGFSAMRLTSAGVSLSKHVSFRLNEFARRYRCVFVEGRVTASAKFDDIAAVACLVANAARAVADYVYELRRQAEYDFRVVVFDRIKEIVGPRIRETEDFVGASGTHYRVPIILDELQAKPQNFLATIANHGVVPRNVTMFFDLGPAYPDVERDAIYADDADIRKEDRALLKSVGTEVFALKEASLRFRQMMGHA